MARDRVILAKAEIHRAALPPRPPRANRNGRQGRLGVSWKAFKRGVARIAGAEAWHGICDLRMYQWLIFLRAFLRLVKNDQKEKGLHRCRPLNLLVVMGGIEPPTYGL